MISTSTNHLEQSKFHFPHSSSTSTSNSITTTTFSNSTGRYSPSNFYRAAAVAAASTDPNNRRYMTTAPWAKSNCFSDSFKFEPNSLFCPTIDDNFFRQAEVLGKPESSSLYYSSAFACASTNGPTSTSSTGVYPSSSSSSSIEPTLIPGESHSTNPHAQLSSDLHPFYQRPYAAVGVLPGMVVGMTHPTLVPAHEIDIDPRELETFAERFKQRRIKLGVTQADVGQQLSKLKMPGVGSLSQSTICRFESLTLSHNNMVALKPVLQAWLEYAEAEARQRKKDEINGSVSTSNSNGNSNGNFLDKKRKRTSIAAQEKRYLESCFLQQQRPSGERIAQIADKLDLKKNVVRVWFCNQRQKNKRLRFAAGPSA